MRDPKPMTLNVKIPSIQVYTAFGNEAVQSTAQYLGVEVPPSDAFVAPVSNDTALVGFTSDAVNQSIIKFLSMLAHESYHLAVFWCQYLSEQEPSEEFMAYLIQECFSTIYRRLKHPM